MFFPIEQKKIDARIASESFKELLQIVGEHPSIQHVDTDFCCLCLKRRSETPQMRRREKMLFCNACGLRMNRMLKADFNRVCFFDSHVLCEFEIEGAKYEVHNDYIYCLHPQVYWRIQFRETNAIIAKDDKNKSINIQFDEKLNVLVVNGRQASSFLLDANAMKQYYISHKGILLLASDLFASNLIQREFVPANGNATKIVNLLKPKVIQQNSPKDTELVCKNLKIWLDNLPVLETDKIDLSCICDIFFIVRQDCSIVIRNGIIRNIVLPLSIPMMKDETDEESIELVEEESRYIHSPKQEEELTITLAKDEVEILANILTKLTMNNSSISNIVDKLRNNQ